MPRMRRTALASAFGMLLLSQAHVASAEEDYFSDGKKQLIFREAGQRSPTERVVLYSLGGAAILAGAVGTYFWQDSRSLSNEVSASQFHTGEAWTPAHQQTYDDALSSRKIAFATLGVSAGLALGTMVAYVITDPGDKVGYQDWQTRFQATPTSDGFVVAQGWSF